MADFRLSIRVECYAGYRGEETPRCFYMKSRKIEVLEVIDGWLAPNHRYFKVSGNDGGLYIIRHDMETDRWELTLFDTGGQAQEEDGNSSPPSRA
jgi:hypothetical protein